MAPGFGSVSGGELSLCPSRRIGATFLAFDRWFSGIMRGSMPFVAGFILARGSIKPGRRLFSKAFERLES